MKRLAAAALLLLAGCGGGDGTSATPTATATAVPTAARYAVPAAEALSAADVGQIVAQAVGEARARALPSVVAVSDRVGNVLAVFTMTGARATATIPLPASGVGDDAQGLAVPAAAGAISKALTAAYLSSGGNAFTTRTASMIVQASFPPAPAGAGLESGPLFGVQFSQLPCSDLVARYQPAGGAGALIGPKRAPLGLSADPGGVPLYKNGVLVGAVGVMGDGVYGFDADVSDVDDDGEEAIAVAGATGFLAPAAITADKVTVDGTALRYLDTTTLRSTPASATYAAAQSFGQLTAVRGYYAQGSTPALLAGTVYGSEASGVRPATAAEFGDVDAFVLSDGGGANRFPVAAGTDANPLTVAEARALLEQAFAIMARARAQIRNPLDSRAQVSIAVVDTNGVPLGLVRAPDAPLFGADVALQKARTAAFFSGLSAGAELTAAGGEAPAFVAAARAFVGPTALTGANAFTDRANGDLSRPHFPDGQLGASPGPFGRAAAQFNPFSTGLQSALIAGNLLQHLAYVGGGATDTPPRCTTLPDAIPGRSRIQNGVQIFPGSVPIYRGSTLVGGIGISGDGIDQDDMIAFLGLYNAGLKLGTIGEAPAVLRADQLTPQGIRLRYVNCPFAPFLDTADQNVCSGK